MKPYLIALLLLSVTPGISLAQDISGKARVVDGDTIWIGKTKIRLHGLKRRQQFHDYVWIEFIGSDLECGLCVHGNSSIGR